MAIIRGIIILLLTDWSFGQETNLPPRVDLVGGGDPTSSGTADTPGAFGFNRRKNGELSTDRGTAGSGVDTNVAVNTVVNTANVEDTAVNAGGTTGVESTFGDGTAAAPGDPSVVDESGIITASSGRTSGQTNPGTMEVNAGGTFDGTVGINSADIVAGTQGGTVRTGTGTSFSDTFGSNTANTAFDSGTTTLTDRVAVGAPVEVNTRTNFNTATNRGNVAGDTGFNTRVNTENVRGNAAINTVGTGGNTGGSFGDSTVRTSVGTGSSTATSGGTVRVGNREGLSASRQNRMPRLPDVSHVDCVQNCMNSLYQSSHHCLFASNNDCQKFVICYKHGETWFGYSYFCPFGKFWFGHACVGFTDYNCNYDRCTMEPTLSSYRDRSLQYVDPKLNCRTYWQCQNGKSFPYCCPYGQAYREGLGCVEDLSCEDRCCPFDQIFVEGVGCREMPHLVCYQNCCPASKDEQYGSCVADQLCVEECIRDQNYEVTTCPYRPVPGHPAMFMVNVNGRKQHRPCSPGTVYMQEMCTCVPGEGDPSVGLSCRPTVHMDFNNDVVKNNNQQLHVKIENITSTNNFGKFGKGSRAIINYYKGNGGILYNIFIELRFYDSNVYRNGKLMGPNAQVLVSNCKTRPGRDLSPSLGIILFPETQQLSFVGISDTGSASFRIRYEPKGWNNVLLRYDGSELYGEVTYQETSGSKELKTGRGSKPLGGKLKTSNVEGMSVGSCSKTDYFEGYMDEIWIFDCIPQTQQFPSANNVPVQ